MPKVIALCGKICSGKTFYANKIKEGQNAVILSTDEATFYLMDNEQGERYDDFAKRVNEYLMKKAIDIVRAGANVILDWGFWSKKERINLTNYYKKYNIPVEWHYVDVTQEKWQDLIKKRNELIVSGQEEYSFYFDDGLKKKLLDSFNEPSKEEMDIWYINKYDMWGIWLTTGLTRLATAVFAIWRYKSIEMFRKF